MTDFLRRTWALISLDNLKNNIEVIKKASGSEICAVIKADGYGHGAITIARELTGCGVRFFAVSNLSEAIELRSNGIEGEILILGYTPPEHWKSLSDNNLTQTVFSPEYAEELNATAKEQINCHLKIDTGMSRLGFVPKLSELLKVYKLKNLKFKGIFTHFAASDESGDFAQDFTEKQYTKFIDIVEKLQGAGIDVGIRHCTNSGAVANYKEYALDMVRCGIILYGVPASDDAILTGLLPLMELKSTVSMVKEIKKGSFVSYGCTFKAPCDMKVATLPIGYADGYSRSLSGKGKVLINGESCFVVGRVCMDQLVIDVSHIDVHEGDVATLFGSDKNAYLPVSEIAEIAGTISYEILCLIGRRVPRVYKKDGSIIAVKDYLGCI